MVDSTGHRVFVGGISWKADEMQLENFFSHHGHVLECKIIMDRVTGKSKGYGFVTFQDADAAERVKQTANFHFLGKNMNVGDAVRKAPETAGGLNGPVSGRSQHPNYDRSTGKNYPPYFNQNYYSRSDDIQYYGHYSPDGMYYPPYYGYPQGYPGNVQYQGTYNGQPFSPFQSDDPSTQDPEPTYPPSFSPYGSPTYSNIPTNFFNLQAPFTNGYNAYTGAYPTGMPLYGGGGFNGYPGAPVQDSHSGEGEGNAPEFIDDAHIANGNAHFPPDHTNPKFVHSNISFADSNHTTDHEGTPASGGHDEAALLHAMQTMHIHQAHKQNDPEQKSQEQVTLSEQANTRGVSPHAQKGQGPGQLQKAPLAKPPATKPQQQPQQLQAKSKQGVPTKPHKLEQVVPKMTAQKS